jgi:hypothetical protein
MIRIKLKISYEAARKKVSILELFVDAIYKSYIDLRYKGDKFKAFGSTHEDQYEVQTEADILGEMNETNVQDGKYSLRLLIGAGGIIYQFLKGFQKLRALRMRLKLNRKRLKDCF